MQKVIISNLKYSNGMEVKTEIIRGIIKSRLDKAGIKIGSEISSDKNTIVLWGKDKLFVSVSENRISLKEGDPRIKGLGRNYLLSKRLNPSQYEAVFSALKEPFDDLGISCDIDYMDDAKKEKWRSGKVTTFPVINTKLLPQKA